MKRKKVIRAGTKRFPRRSRGLRLPPSNGGRRSVCDRSRAPAAAARREIYVDGLRRYFVIRTAGTRTGTCHPRKQVPRPQNFFLCLSRQGENAPPKPTASRSSNSRWESDHSEKNFERVALRETASLDTCFPGQSG